MIAYKFRSASQIAYIFDILINKRLYCTNWKMLNDPMEGHFVYSYNSTDEKDTYKDVERVINEKHNLKICSLSRTINSHLLWAHYAGGFDGVAIEIKLPNDRSFIKNVNYRRDYTNLVMSQVSDPFQSATEILSSKYIEWEYEKEIRIIHTKEWFHLRMPVTKVIAGHRMPPALFEAMNIICNSMGIKFYRTNIGKDGIGTEIVAPSRVISLTNKLDWDAIKLNPNKKRKF